MDFKCKKCGLGFDSKWRLKRHMERKTPCEPIIDVATHDSLTCRYCGRNYKHKSGLERHILNSCKVYKDRSILVEHIRKKKKEEEKDKKIEKLENEMEQLKKKLNSVVKNIDNSDNSNNVNNSNNISNTSNTSNNVDNSTNINININTPEIANFEYGSMSGVIDEFLSIINSYLRKNKNQFANEF